MLLGQVDDIKGDFSPMHANNLLLKGDLNGCYRCSGKILGSGQSEGAKKLRAFLLFHQIMVKVDLNEPFQTILLDTYLLQEPILSLFRDQ
jgi:hypothetical protein